MRVLASNLTSSQPVSWLKVVWTEPQSSSSLFGVIGGLLAYKWQTLPYKVQFDTSLMYWHVSSRGEECYYVALTTTPVQTHTIRFVFILDRGTYIQRPQTAKFVSHQSYKLVVWNHGYMPCRSVSCQHWVKKSFCPPRRRQQISGQLFCVTKWTILEASWPLCAIYVRVRPRVAALYAHKIVSFKGEVQTEYSQQ
jgi:hypothetical protein